jgi:hypothetical protein
MCHRKCCRTFGRSMPLVVYGLAKDVWVIILANSIGVMISLAVLCFKIREFIS